jgi:tetratricopeptide (TPR) repeat protein
LLLPQHRLPRLLAFLHESFDDARAVAVWQQLLEQASEHLQAMVRLAEGLLLLEQHAQAQLMGERALSLGGERGDDVEVGRARNVLGRAYLHQGQYHLAEKMFKSAAVSTPGSRWGCAYQSLGQLYTTLGEVDLPPIDATAE